jgi:hypothetical protein
LPKGEESVFHEMAEERGWAETIGLERAGNDESRLFQKLQQRFADQFREIFSDPAAPRTVLILPSLTLDRQVLAKISGARHYEQRMLCLLMLLRLPHTRVIYVTSEPIPQAIIDYYLHLLPGIPRDHAQRRLTLLCCYDSSDEPLTEKLLSRPRMIERLRASIGAPERAHMTCFNVAGPERRLALRLGIPIYGCDPDLLPLGSKSGSRAVFKEAGLRMPEGFEDLADADAVIDALTELKARLPSLRRAVVKLNEGFSGEGNAVFDYSGAPGPSQLKGWIAGRLPEMGFVAHEMDWGSFNAKIEEMGGIVEAFVEGEDKRSPSAQYRIDPTGRLDVISTHDQVTGGQSGQVFHGCCFPADQAYRLEIQAEGLMAGEALKKRGVLGRFGVDFISVRNGDCWDHYAVEINLRKGGTTHPFLMLQYLTDGAYDPASGLFHTRGGLNRYYYASDNLEAPHYRGLTPDDLIDIAVENGLHFHSANQDGVVFHLIGALSEFGKVGLVCVAESPEAAKRLYRETVAVLDREGQRAGAT